LRRVDETMIQRDCKRCSESEWNRDAGRGDGKGETCMAADDRCINLKPNKEEEKTQANVRNKREVRYRLGREDVFGKTGYTTKGSGA